MPPRRVVITGLGIVAPNGIGKAEFWDALINGRSGIKKITSFDTSLFPTKIAGEITDFTPQDYFDPKLVKRSARFCHLGVAAAKLAIEDSSINFNHVDKEKCGVCFATTVGAENDIYAGQHEKYLAHGPAAVSRYTAPEITPHVVTGYICADLKITGPNTTISSGCISGIDVMDWGYGMIKKGYIDIAIVGSADSVMFPFSMSMLCSLGILSRRNNEPEKASRPYEKNRDGMVASEGSAAIIIEELHHALERGANIYAEIVSYATSCEAQDIFQVELEGSALVFAMQQALLNGGVRKDEIDYICAHGNAIPSYDLAETNAFKTFFADDAYKIPVSSIKSMTGHPFAAAGSFQVVATCMCLKEGIIPPTINLDEPDPECDLDYVPHEARRFPVNTAMINCHGVGNSHAVLVLKNYSGEDDS